MSARPTLAVLAVSLAACSGASCASDAARRPDAGAGAASTETVTLRFAWPDDFRARVALDHRTLRDGGQPTRAVVRHQLTTERKDGELWVRVSGTHGEGDEPGLQLNLAIGEALVQVVGRDGAFKRAEGLDAAVAILRRGAAGDGGDKARESIRRQVTEDWETTVGAWRGRKLTAGEPVKAEQQGALALLPSVTGAMEVEFLFRGRVPCEEGQAEARCVELFRRVHPAKKGKQEILAQVAAALPGNQGAALKSVGASSEAVLTTEPDTLVPHRLLLRDQLSLTLEGPDGAQRSVTERSEDSYHFAAETAL